jgi:hypothetical protein
MTSLAQPRRSRRLSTRRALVLPCQAVRLRDFTLIADTLIDLSVDGVLLPVGFPMLTGEALIVSFQIPGTWIDAEAVVTRVIHGRRPGDEGLAVGAIFDVMGPASRAALAGFLHGRPPPLPRRGPLSRMRRGHAAPQLADHLVMETPVCTPTTRPPKVIPVPAPVIDVDDEAEAISDAEAIDAQSLICALVGAWRDLANGVG